MSKTDFTEEFIKKFYDSVTDRGKFLRLLQNLSEDDMIYLFLLIKCNIEGDDIYEVARGN